MVFTQYHNKEVPSLTTRRFNFIIHSNKYDSGYMKTYGGGWDKYNDYRTPFKLEIVL